MPRPGRKRTRSEVDGGGDGEASRRRHRHENEVEEEDEGDEAGPSGSGNGSGLVDEDDDEDLDNSQAADDGQSHRAWRLPAGYNDRHRAFLQALLARGALTFRQAQPLLAAILNVEREAGEDESGGAQADLTADDITLDDVREFVDQAKAALAPLDFDVRSATDEHEGGGTVWALVSTDHDPKAHLAVLFPPRKLAFVHRLLAALFDTYNTPRIEALCLTEQQALKLSRPPRSRQSDAVAADGGSSSAAAANRDKGLKHSVVLALLQSLVRQGWLARSAQGFYSLTTRALLELEPLLVETFNDPQEGGGDEGEGAAWQRVKYCAACRELVTAGLRCATPACALRLHDRCEAAFWRTQAGGGSSRVTNGNGNRNGDGRHACPRCRAPWGKWEDDQGNVEGKLYFVGERAITTTDVYRHKRRQGRASEGVDDLMRALLPRASTGGGGPASGPLEMALGRRREHANGDEDGDGEEEEE